MVRASRLTRPILLTCASLLLCCGCGLSRSVPFSPPPVLCQQNPTLTPLTMEPTPFRVVRDSEGLYWIAMDGRAYEAMARNINAMRLALSEARTIIAYYKTCTAGETDGSQ